jgi:hypothetical protein
LEYVVCVSMRRSFINLKKKWLPLKKRGNKSPL